MGDVTKLEPLVLGYALLTPSGDEAKRIAIEARLSAFAARSGLMLGAIYFDGRANATAGFSNLLAAITSCRATGVVLPSLDDLGERADQRIAQLEDELSVVIHVAHAVTTLTTASRTRP
ncbi:hypothetical protein [Kribbella deserti]|uniref:Resolvase/invertase-type recombinase catalytic domain-containing protein n=1 Tax=Kribbella deserti TaxID=1926257 RepID=A0ABV6QS11_9ACTN